MRHQFNSKSRLRFLSAIGSISSCGRISYGYVVVINFAFCSSCIKVYRFHFELESGSGPLYVSTVQGDPTVS